ncbi:cytochrome P450 [Lentinula novae-zelandiae]|nr:cytochrome P450 [Lentinula novae-zelandiae]
MYHQIIILALVFAAFYFYKDKVQQSHHLPPIVPIPLEFIVDDSLALEILTNDADYSAERGTAAILNMPMLLMLPHSLIGGLDKLITKRVVPSMDTLIPRLLPIFEQHIFSLTSSAVKIHNLHHGTQSNEVTPVPVSFVPAVHNALAEAMLTLIVGNTHQSPHLCQAAIKVAFDIAIVAGIYQNVGYWSRTFPTTWRVVTWIPWSFRHIAWCTWQDLRTFQKTGNSQHIDPVSGIHISRPLLQLELPIYPYQNCLVYQMIKDVGKPLDLRDCLWIICLTMGIVFASIHQTSTVVIWVVYQLAIRRESIPVLREELSRVLEIDVLTNKPSLTFSSLRNAQYLDSFIREVMRTKGDTLTVFRMTTRDIKIDQYIIPRNSFITPLATLSHESPKYYGEDAKVFIANRWVGSDKSSASIGPAYWPFGLGRYACPGRALAIAEIKLIVFCLIGRADIFLQDDHYKIVDPLNITAVPPEGQLLIQPLDHYIY